MQHCIFVPTGNEDGIRKEYRCADGCQQPIWSANPPDRIRRVCLGLIQRPRGPGAELTALLAELDIHDTKGCDCKSKARQMDNWGPAGCREHFQEIVDWLRESAKRLGWLARLVLAAKAIATGLAFRLDPLDPCPGLVREAIHRADTESIKLVRLTFKHGLGDHVQFMSVLRHIQELRKDLRVWLECKQEFRPLYDGLCEKGPVPSAFDFQYRIDWPEPSVCFNGTPSTKVERCLSEVFGINPRPELCRYPKIVPSASDQEKARNFSGYIVIHAEGASYKRNKDLPPAAVTSLLRMLDSLGVPYSFLKGTNSPSGLAAIAEQAVLCVGIDSGPEHVWACTNAKAIVCWTKNHPVHYFAPADNLLHLVPVNHYEALMDNPGHGIAFFRDNYRHLIYTDLADSLCTAVRQALGFSGGEITLNVPQGLGDIWWPYQLAAPHFDRINLNLSIVHSTNQQMRSLEWPGLLPKVGTLNFRLIGDKVYERMAYAETTTAEILSRYEAGETEQDLACNGWLESGKRLEAMGEPEWTVDVRSDPHGLPFERYVCLAVSGDTIHHHRGVWTIEQWLQAVDLLYRRYAWDLPIVLLGADFDKPATDRLAAGLRERGYTVDDSLVSRTLCARKVDAIKHCSFFLGYQSGLNILADNYDRPQLMVFFDRLEKMLRTFCKPENLEAGLFNPCLFRDGPEAAIESIAWGPARFGAIWDDIQGITLYDDHRAWLLYDCCREVERLPGDVVEVGTYRGGTARLLARALPHKRVWTCDTFQGLSPNGHDDKRIAGKFADAKPGEVTLPWNARLLVGDFRQMAPAVDRLSLMHFDADLFGVCQYSLQWAWERLVPGGIIFVDDYGRGDCPGVKRAVDEFGKRLEVVPELQVAWMRKDA